MIDAPKTAGASAPRSGRGPIKGACPVCGRNNGRFVCSFRPADLDEAYNLARCGRCLSAYVDPRPAAGDLARYFGDRGRYHRTTDPEGRTRSLLAERDSRRREYAGYARRVRNMAGGGRVLDIGCGTGLFLELLGPQYQRLGLDINPVCAEYAAGNLDFDVRETDVMQAEFPRGSFEVITAMQTLDHLADPGLILDRVARWLVPGGLLFLSALINIDSPMSRLFGADFRLLHPCHVAYFSAQGLKKELGRRGLSTVRVEYPYFRTPYFSAAEVASLAARTGRRLLGGNGGVKSPPFIGNIMNFYASKEPAA
jgi:SAM-dependent methyltransferase